MSDYQPSARELQYDRNSENFYVDEELLVKRIFGEDYQDAWQQHINELDPSRLIPSRQGVGYFAGMYFNNETIPLAFGNYSFQVQMFDNLDRELEEVEAVKQTAAWKRLLDEGFQPFQKPPMTNRNFDFENAAGWIFDSFYNEIPSGIRVVSDDYFMAAARVYDQLNNNVLKAYISHHIADKIRELYDNLYRFWQYVSESVTTLAAEAKTESEFWKDLHNAVPDFREIIRRELKLLFRNRVVDENTINCANCGSLSKYACGRCMRVGYCSQKCYIKKLSEHKGQCNYS
jgi:hypothetical protein